jgi:hypothetical protein
MSVETELHERVVERSRPEAYATQCKVPGCMNDWATDKGPHARLCTVHADEHKKVLSAAQKTATKKKRKALVKQAQETKAETAKAAATNGHSKEPLSLARLIEDLAESVDYIDELAAELDDERQWAKGLSAKIAKRLDEPQAETPTA